MDKEDGRKLTRQAQHERRKQAVRLHRRGMSVKDIATALEMAQGTVRSAIKAAEQGGLKALAPKLTGRSVGDKRRLTAEQELHIQRLICKQRPEQLKLTFVLWSRAAVLLLVKQEFGIELPIYDGRIPQTVGLHTAKAHHTGLRTGSRGGQGLAG